MTTEQSTNRRIGRIIDLLERHHGRREWRSRGPAVDVLVATILSQNTSGANSSAGYKRLRERFGDWDSVADAPTRSIERCIRVSGLSRIKAPRIRRILRAIRLERGRIDLQFLRRLGADKAGRHLTRFNGVGPKTAGCVLLFAFGMKVLPVDTHVRRLAERLGLAPAGASPEQTEEILTSLVAPNRRYALHVLLIAHGRSVCRARNPLCASCPLACLCPTAAVGI